MTKIAIFKIDHCCLCPCNEMKLDIEQEFWCKLKRKKLNDTEYADFPEWCPKPQAETLINPDEVMDLEEYLRERCLDAKKTEERDIS